MSGRRGSWMRERRKEERLSIAWDGITGADVLDDAQVAHASVQVAAAKVLSTEVAILATNKLFELSGTRSVLSEYNL
ncbi:hypothetical protein LAM19_24370, partial [Mycobacterium tuberculosis]|nr:hypothetical protein [Mycobacterium tuberculosis]